jgi:CRISPR-associated protein Csd1
VALNLRPYEDRLSASKPGLMFWLNKELEKVYALFAPEDFTDDRALSGEFLLGFYCQRSALWTTKTDSSSETEEA